MFKEQVFFRPVTIDDVELLMAWENNPVNWEVSDTLKTYSRKELEDFIKDSQLDIYITKQIRFMICLDEENTIGTLDFFDFDPYHLRAGIGILIGEEKFRKKGYAHQALNLASIYAKNSIGLKQIYCDINIDNTASIKLFEKNNYKLSGVKSQWIRTSQGFKDVGFYQLIL